jgi:AraC family transcriptional regulator of arabinose operon
MDDTLEIRAAKVVFGEVRYEPGGTCGPRVQQEYQLVLIQEGWADIDIDGRTFRLEKGHVSFHLPGRREHFVFAGTRPTLHSWCAVQPEGLSPQLEEAFATAPRTRPISRRLEAAVAAGLALGFSGDAVVEALRRKLGEAALLEYLLDAAPGHAHEALLPEPVRRARRHMDLHWGEPIDLDVLGERAHVTPSHLVRLFRQHLGTTPMRYLWDVRLRRARQLITGTGLPMADIAWQCGFKTPAHFARAIKERYGVSPRGLRQQAWVQPGQGEEEASGL